MSPLRPAPLLSLTLGLISACAIITAVWVALWIAENDTNLRHAIGGGAVLVALFDIGIATYLYNAWMAIRRDRYRSPLELQKKLERDASRVLELQKKLDSDAWFAKPQTEQSRATRAQLRSLNAKRRRATPSAGHAAQPSFSTTDRYDDGCGVTGTSAGDCGSSPDSSSSCSSD